MSFLHRLESKIVDLARTNKPMRSVLVPLSKFYVNLSGYKKLGLRYDDILMEETVEMQKALSRLTEKEKYDRQYRMKRALMAGVRHENLKPEDHTTSEQDISYIMPHLKQVEKEEHEKAELDNARVK